MSNIIASMTAPDPAAAPTPAPGVITSDGSTIPAVISGVTAHTWTADSTGLYHTNADLASEWTVDYTRMVEGMANALSPLQRMEGNAEAVLENTAAGKFSADKLVSFREDAQREFDAIYAAMRIDALKYGIDPTREFNTYTYQRMEETLQANESLQELGYQGHGVNQPPATKYDGFTTDFQNKTDGKTYYVGGSTGTGELAIADFFDDDVLTHAPFPAVEHNGVMEQLNQNGSLENAITDAVAAANTVTYAQVFLASDFSTDKTAQGGVMAVTDIRGAPDLPVPAAGQFTTLDGSVVSGTISGVTAHTWVADSTGTFQTTTNLQTEWATDYHLALQGAALNPLQHLEANAEAVLENTKAINLTPAKQAAFRADAQREFDATYAAMMINATTLGIPATAQFTQTSYLAMERTLRFNEQLEDLAIQGHGLNRAPAPQYAGFTGTFQNTVDNTTLYTGTGLDHGEKAIANFFDDAIITHASFPTVLHNGVLEQLNQNGNNEDTIANVVTAANDLVFQRILLSTDFAQPTPTPTPTPPAPAT